MTATGNELVTLNQLKISLESSPSGGGLLDAWPIGSIYISVNSTSPANLFGGSWEEIQGRFLLGRDGSHVAGSAGGEEKHKLTVNEMPEHSHFVRYGSKRVSKGNDYSANGGVSPSGAYGGSTDTKGSGLPHNNMPPYLAVYMWKRTA